MDDYTIRLEHTVSQSTLFLFNDSTRFPVITGDVINQIQSLGEDMF